MLSLFVPSYSANFYQMQEIISRLAHIYIDPMFTCCFILFQRFSENKRKQLHLIHQLIMADFSVINLAQSIILLKAWSCRVNIELQVRKETSRAGGNAFLDFDIIDEEENYMFGKASSKQTVPRLSDTRWLSTVDTLTWLVEHYSTTMEALEMIRDESSGKSSSNATSQLNSLLNVEFIMVVVVTQYITCVDLSPVSELWSN